MNDLRQVIGSDAFSDLDRHFVGFIEAQAGGERPALALAAALVSRRRSGGHICLDIEGIAGSVFPEKPVDGLNSVEVPSLEDWIKELKTSPVVGSPGEFRPLVLDAGHRLYLHRYWEYEQILASEILKRMADKPEELDNGALKQGLQELFPTESSGAVNWQCVAAFAATRGKFCVISGGPGTGKTHTLVLILALLLELERSRKLRIAVTAPTGKAAARIQESIRNVKEALTCSEEIKAKLPERATTIHRLLGYIPDSAYFRHNADNRLPYDVIAVDEASMVDLALMAKLFQAVSPSARLILLGDKDQLASVEAGAVLGDICSAVAVDAFSDLFRQDFEKLTGQRLPTETTPGNSSVLADSVVQLKKNYRFGTDSEIFRLSNAINEGRVEEGSGIIRDCINNSKSDLSCEALPHRADLKETLRERVLAGFSEYLKASDPIQALTALNRFRVLCALREGPFGVAGLNQLAAEILEEVGLIRTQSSWYARRPIMITRNDYNLKLFNGDIGVILHDRDSGEPRAFFPGPENTVRKFLPIRLPEHETAYAMTVHKSQGSEFDDVLLVLPDKENPVLTRELIYTGLTRARKSVRLLSNGDVLRAAIQSRVQRISGLREALEPSA